MNPPSEQNGAEEISRQVRVEAVWGLLRNLARSLFARGLSGEKIRDVYAGSIRVSCESCGSELKEADLVALLDAASDTRLANPKLNRLHKGYCFKPGCNSYFYRLTFRPAEGIDWTTALPEAEALPAKLAAEEKRQEPFTWESFIRSPRFRISAGLVVLAGLLVYRNWYFNGTLPFVSQRFETANPHPEFSRAATRPVATAGSIRASTLNALAPDERATTNSRIRAAPKPK